MLVIHMDHLLSLTKGGHSVYSVQLSETGLTSPEIGLWVN
jgi:hypothetical protein